MTPYAVIGQPIAHSQSPQLHRDFATDAGVSMHYGKISCSIHAFKQTIAAFQHAGGLGLSVTLPFKFAALQLADSADAMACLTQAANGLKFDQQRILACNSDGPGLITDLIDKGIHLQGQRVLLIGAGGAAQGIVPALAEASIASLSLSNRSQARTRRLIDFYHSLTSIQRIDDSTQAFDVVINASSAGHCGQTPPLQAHWFHANSVAYDLSYGQAAHPFLQACQELGCRQTIDGSGMLYHSAKHLFNWWMDNTA